MTASPLIIENLLIEKYAAKGKGLGYYQGKVVFVRHAIPGDLVSAKVIKKKKNFAEAVIAKIHKPSADRQIPFCEHFGICGGCNWQNLTYEKQLAYKMQEVKESFAKITSLDEITLYPILPSKHTEFYRNKLEFTFSNNRWFIEEEKALQSKERNALGFHIPGRFDKVLDIKKCYLQASPSNDIRLAVKDFALENDLTFYDPRRHTGLLRNLIIRNSSQKDCMVIISFAQNDKMKRKQLFDFLIGKFPQVTSWMYVINAKLNDSILDLAVHPYYGKGVLSEKINSIDFTIGPKSFFQTNLHQANKLYEKIVELATFSPQDIVYDLYAGSGTISCFIAPHVSRVIAVESLREAAQEAKRNFTQNTLTNVEIFEGKVEDILKENFIAAHRFPQYIILDPPRVGLHPKVIKELLRTKVKNILYVSCNIATQVRDLALLQEIYRIKKIQPLDMFPHTHHIENLVLLQAIS